MRHALVDTYSQVEQEAARGRLLTEQINTISAQTEAVTHITEVSIMKTEEANIEVMKNIRRLRRTVEQYEQRLKSFATMRMHQQSTPGGASFIA